MILFDICTLWNLFTNIYLFVHPDQQAAETSNVYINMKQNFLKIYFTDFSENSRHFQLCKKSTSSLNSWWKRPIFSVNSSFLSNPDFLIQIQIISGPISWKKSGSRPKSGKRTKWKHWYWYLVKFSFMNDEYIHIRIPILPHQDRYQYQYFVCVEHYMYRCLYMYDSSAHNGIVKGFLVQHYPSPTHTIDLWAT